MKNLVLIIFIVFTGPPIIAQQEVHLPPAILTAAGSAEGESTSLSRWRLARVHTLTLPENMILSSTGNGQEVSELDQLISIYPNPTEKFLYLKFDLPEAREFIIKLTDVTGRVLSIRDATTIQPGETVELDLSRYASAIYLLQISTRDLAERKIFRIQKI